GMSDSSELRSLLRDPAPISGRIALYGGTFDPVQRAHLEVARRACESFDLSELIFIPANQNPLKSHSPGASNSDRLQMLDLAIGAEARFYVSDLEISRQQGPSYTVETVHYFKQHLTSASKLYFLCGSDNLPRLHQWHRIEEIFSILDGF